MAIDLAIGRAITAIRALERATHDHGRWTMSMGDVTVSANRYVTDEGVQFSGEFPRRVNRDCPLILSCDGDLVLVREATVPEGSFVIHWDLTLPTAVAA